VNTTKHKLTIPEGWTLEDYSARDPDFIVLIMPAPLMMFATIDLKKRGFRSGITTIGLMSGHTLTKRGYRGKKYEGRGWMQQIIDDAVDYLKKVEAGRK
jgi:hypothetical protein